jgi:type II secretory pathway component PulK
MRNRGISQALTDFRRKRVIPSEKNRPSAVSRQGFTLVIVLWLLAALTVLTLGMGRRAMLERRAATYAADAFQAMLMARGAVQRGIVEVRNKALMDFLEEETAGTTHLGQEWAKPKDLLEDERYFERNAEMAKDHVWFFIEDLDRYIDVNSCRPEVLDNVKSLSRSARRKILSRRTEGEFPGESRNPFQTVEEIRNLEGVSDEDWFGRDDKPGLQDMLSIAGGPHINLNTAPEAVLKCIPGLNQRFIDAILGFRAGPDGEIGTADDRGFKHLGQVADYLGDRANAMDTLRMYCKTNSNYFKITAVATRRSGKVRAICSAIVNVNQGDAQVIAWREETLGF